MPARRPAGLAIAILAGLLVALGPRLVARPVPGVPALGADLGAAPVAASCATTPSVGDAVTLGDVVFVGTVLRTENGGRWATVRVEERWKGARDLADTVAVHGGPDPGSSTTLDQVYSPGRYLFVVRNGQGFLVDDQCTATTPWTDDLARLRPAGVSPDPDVVANAQVSELDIRQFMPLAALAGALIVAVMAYLIILRARRRPPDWMR